MRLLSWLCVSGAVSGAGAVLSYTAPETNRTLTICTCAKCGSTSIAKGFFEAVTGTAFRVVRARGERPWVQNVRGWKDHPDCSKVPACAEGVRAQVRPPDDRKEGDTMIIATRDPIDRYISAFQSKIACCGSPGSSSSRKRCSSDGGHRAISLLRAAGLPGSAACLYWGEYADALRRSQRSWRGTGRGRLDTHFQPQPNNCANGSRSGAATTHMVDIADFGDLVNGLEGYGPVPSRYPKDNHAHRANTRSQGVFVNATTLCSFVLPEYAALGRDVPAACAA